MEKGESDEVREESPKRYLTSYQDVGKETGRRRREVVQEEGGEKEK